LNPKLSICITAFNVGPYLRQCIESALQQVISFPFEIVIVDDASTDESAQIIREYQLQYPAVVQAYYNQVNLRYAQNYFRALSLCKGEYIAILDGDDYWTDHSKLKQQLIFLDAHPNYMLSYHNAWMEDPGGIRMLFDQQPKPETQDLLWFLSDARKWNSSFVYRNIYQGDLPKWLKEAHHPDFSIHALHAARGPAYYINKPMGVYRQHTTNISKLWENDRAILDYENAVATVHELKNELSKDFRSALNLIEARHHDLIAGYYRKRKQWGKFLTNVLRGYLLCPVRSIKEYKDSYYHLFRQP
jgi:glycosyltransferase involved in cell wall biosynthesis